MRSPGIAELSKTLVIACAIFGAGVLGFAYAASGTAGDLPAKMSAPPPRPAVEERLAAIPRVPTPRPAAGDQQGDAGIVSGMPEEERACRARLFALGVKFEAVPEISDEGACGIAYPIKVSSLAADIELTPEGVMNCALAETAAQLVRQTVDPEAKKQLGSRLSGIRQASTYVCRNRASGKKVSEHARGNALDISAFLLKDGRIVEVEAYGPADKPERGFMRAVRRAACGPFKTVLGPGTDADHALHFHFDLQERRRGSTYCK